MDDTNTKEKLGHLSFQDFLSQIAGVSFNVAPELEQIYEILQHAEARERHSSPGVLEEKDTRTETL